MLAAARRAVDAAQLAARGGVGQLRFGSAGTFPNELAMRLVRDFRRRHSAVEVRLSQSGYISCPLADIDRDRVDVALVRAPLAISGVSFEPLVQERRMLALGAGHRLAGRRSVALEEIGGDPIVSSAHWPQRLRDYWAGVDDGADPAYVVSVLAHGPGEWLDALAEGRGVCLCPSSISSYCQRDDLAFTSVEQLTANAVGLAYRRGRGGPLVSNFIASAKAYVATHGLGRWHQP